MTRKVPSPVDKEAPAENQGPLYFPRRWLRRQLALSILWVAIPAAAFSLDIDAGLKYFALLLSVVSALFLLFFLGATSEKGKDPVSAEKIYGRGALIGLGVYWLILILGIAVVLYLKFPRP